MKKLFALVFSLVMAVGCIPMAAADELATVTSDYETVVAEIMRNYEKDPTAAKAALAELDTELVGEPRSVDYIDGQPVSKGSIGTRKTNPTDYTLTVYSLKRGNSSNYHLQWRLDCNKTEKYPGSLDFISLEWDTTFARYYSASGDGTYSSVAGRETGIVLFNLEDEELKKNDWAQGTVYVTPEVAGEMEYGSKFTHSYTEKATTSTMTHKFEPSFKVPKSLGLTYTFGYTVTTNSSTFTWELWADNATTLHL